MGHKFQTSFMYNLKEFKDILNPLLNDFVDQKTKQLLTNTKDPFIKDFVSYSRNLIVGGGKRIRPYMAYLAYKAFGGINEEGIMNIFISLELFHNFCLIHDDVIDKGKTRHSEKTIHEFVLEKLKKEKRIGNLEHVANSQAILIGDIIYSWLIELFFDNKNLKNLEIAKQYFYLMTNEVLMGQIIDTDLATRDNPDLNLIEEKTRLKTSRYSFVRPMQIGAILANKDHRQDDFFEILGTNLGMAFQIKDDLLDIMGNQNKIQKTPLLDITQHQHTFFTYYVFNKGTNDQKSLLSNYFGKQLLESDKKILRSMFEQSGAISYGEKIIQENFSKAKSLIENAHLEKELKQKFLGLIKLIEKRKN